MPWELGYFDAHKGRVAILPIVDEGKAFQGQEYLSLYPYIDLTGVKDNTSKSMWVNKALWNMFRLQSGYQAKNHIKGECSE